MREMSSEVGGMNSTLDSNLPGEIHAYARIHTKPLFFAKESSGAGFPLHASKTI